MSNLSISNVINISVAQAGTGIGKYNTSNLGLFTGDTPESSFGTEGYKLYLEPVEVGVDFGTSSDTYKMAVSVFSQKPNILAGGGYLAIIPLLASEKIDAAITRTSGIVQYFGAMAADIEVEADLLATAAVVQALNKIYFAVSHAVADVETGGKLDLLRSGGFTQTRGLLYANDLDQTDSLVMMAAYAGRALSTNFEGASTTQTMHLKDLVGIQPDSLMTQTLLGKCGDAGVDVYASIEGVSKVYTSGANEFFDDVYNLQWIVGELSVAGFNVLATVATKVPQNEAGLSLLKGAYRKVCEQGITNGFLSAGEWTSPVTFGIQEDLYNNVEQRGYYIYSQPVAQQSTVAREARQAPVVQLALKYAGANHSSSVIVNINK